MRSTSGVMALGMVLIMLGVVALSVFLREASAQPEVPTLPVERLRIGSAYAYRFSPEPGVNCVAIHRGLSCYVVNPGVLGEAPPRP